MTKEMRAKMEAEARAIEIKNIINNGMTIKRAMEIAGDYIVRFTTMVSNRFDSKAFREAHGRLYKRYMKQMTTKRFSIA